jgi:8-oxo-dGTP pyrophosphatase MutT (NUDIX family)
MQMYKVFIENKSVIITETDSSFNFCPELDGKSVKSLEKDILPILLNPEVNSVVVRCKNASAKFKLLFKNYELIQAAGGIVQRKNRILVIKRNGKWDLPKGKIEIDELNEVAAIREIEEECGITGPTVEDFLCETYHTYVFKDKQVIKRTYWYLLAFSGKKNLIPQEEEGISKAKWLKKSKLVKIKKNTFSSILEVIAAFEEKFKKEEQYLKKSNRI